MKKKESNLKVAVSEVTFQLWTNADLTKRLGMVSYENYNVGISIKGDKAKVYIDGEDKTDIINEYYKEVGWSCRI